ncbi:MAG: putative protein N(5)-glutamine methyltransferase [Microbacteriaceae bacterium]|nr:putative protein N(5)-glutamine methyltransferase [Microbacteriaceae bacterium]
MPAEAEIVLALRAAGCVFAEDEARLIVESGGDLDAMIARRVAGEPLEQILGWAEFCGLRILVEPGVFVPRFRTGFLVERAALAASPALAPRPALPAVKSGEWLSGGSSEHPLPDFTRSGVVVGRAAGLGSASPVVVDLCCGAGAIGAALLARMPGLDLYAADLDPAAVRSARRNLPPLRVFEGDLFDALPRALRGRVDVLVANAPYVPTQAIATMPPEARIHEHRMALDGGADGLDFHRRIADSAGGWLAAGGSVLIETGEQQAPLTAALFENAGLAATVAHSDDFDGTVVTGRAPL